MRVGRERLLAVVAVAVACGSPVPRPEPDAPSLADPDRVAREVREASARVETLRARVSVEGSGLASPALEGILLVERPGRARLRLALPLGTTVLDLLARDGDVTVTSRGGDRTPIDDESLRRELLRVLGGGPGSATKSCEARSSGAVVEVACAVEGDAERLVTIDPGTARVVEERTFEGGRLRFRTRYGDYETVDGIALPTRIRFDDLDRDLSLRIRAFDQEVNRALSPRAFEPVGASP